MLTAKDFERISVDVATISKKRLESHQRECNLVTYEGTLLDRLCLHFVSQVWPTDSYRVVCSVRPCMHPLLQAEVRSYAARHGYFFLDYVGDCEVDSERGQFVSVQCNNISMAVTSRLKGTRGLLVLSALLNGWSRRNFLAINSELQSYTLTSKSLHLLEPGSGTIADWQTLFLFEGLSPIEILATYLWSVSCDLELHHIPLCYLSCYNEEQQVLFRNKLDQMKRLVANTARVGQSSLKDG